ncbi:S1/P1 nuclease [Pelomonas sp. KK5]|uniref:S1/P1 nuclease n=1 Tax=Pelomonas sp. KK5 TaxID=1855730 RepID=UPI0009FB71B6|nr:S1/P1 nuclease [Pelomonas sp. KK5]
MTIRGLRSAAHGAMSLVAVVLSLATPTAAFAYGADGHRSIGAIADTLLKDTPTGAKVNQLLGGLTLSQVAVWADCAKNTKPDGSGKLVYSGTAGCKDFDGPEWKPRFENFVTSNWVQCGPPHGGEYCHHQYHYADVSTLRSRYSESYVGTNTHDIVHSINAAIAMLQDRAVPPPFRFADKREALMLLAHYIGDIHQPLHVEALYLDATGTLVDPDATGYRADNDTEGGNSVFDKSQRFHGEWDDVPAALKATGAHFASMVGKAKALPIAAGDVYSWSAAWASEVIQAGKPAFASLTFAPKLPATDPPQWLLSGEDDAYRAQAALIKEDLIAKAGARLAQVLTLALADNPPVCADGGEPQVAAYANGVVLPDIAAWLPEVPRPNSVSDRHDSEVFWRARDFVAADAAGHVSPRGKSAAEDDIFDAEAVLCRFGSVIGASLTMANAPDLVRLIARAKKNAGAFVGPIKLSVSKGGRVRPFVLHPEAPSCLAPVDWTGHKDSDLGQFGLAGSGSYPSTHALVGMFVGLVLAELEPERGAVLIGRGLEFGESRIVCGFHYASDVEAGRLAGAALLSALRNDSDFRGDLEKARAQVRAALSQ